YSVYRMVPVDDEDLENLRALLDKDDWKVIISILDCGLPKFEVQH
ncbi:hypothetical protein AVEN_27323-1, partial [Araneus ventricosus]